VEELEQRLAEMNPYVRSRYQTLEQRQDYAESLARFEAMVQEATRRGLQNDPDVVETAKQVMVKKLIQQELDNQASPVSDADLAAYYDKHRTDYVKPEMIRLSGVFIDGKDKQAVAEGLLQKAKAMQPLDFIAFGKLARESTDNLKTKSTDGDMHFLSADELTQQYGATVAQAGAALKANGELSPLVETTTGYAFVKLQGRQPALNLTVEQVKPQLQTRILNERRQARFDQFVAQVRKQSGYTVDSAALSRVTVDMKAPPKEAKGPPPGMLPATSAGARP